MRFVLVYNRDVRIGEMAAWLRDLFPDSEITQFIDPMLSAEFILNHPVDVVLTEANMKRVTGLQLLKVLRKQKPDLPIVVLAADESRRADADDLAADGYWVWPVTDPQLRSLQTLSEVSE